MAEESKQDVGSAPGKNPRRFDIGAVAAIAGFCTIFFWPCLFGGKYFLPLDELAKYYPWKAELGGVEPHNSMIADAVVQFLPWRMFVERTLANGEVPLWNPHLLAGQPFAANAQSAIFYPFSFLTMMLFEPAYGMGVDSCLHMFLAGLFCYLTLRHLRFSRAACLASAFAFMLSGWFVVWMSIPSFFKSAIWLPLMILFYETARRRRNALYAALGGSAVACAFLAGQFQLAAYQLICLYGYAFLAWHFSRREEKSVRILACAAGCALLMSVVGVALAAVQIAPSLELVGQSYRPTIKPGLWGIFFPGMGPGSLMRLLAPDFFGNPARGAVWVRSNYCEFTGYIGVAPLILALLGRSDRRGKIGLTLMAGALLLALGTPLYAPIYYLVPGMKKVAAHRAIVLFPLISPLAAAAGWDLVFRRARRALSAPSIAMAAIGCLAAFAALFAYIVSDVNLSFDVIRQRTAASAIKFLLLTAAVAGCVLIARGQKRRAAIAALAALIAADLLPFAAVYNTMAPKRLLYPKTQIKAFLDGDESVFRIQTDSRSPIYWYGLPLAEGFSSIEAYESLYQKRYADFLQAIDRANGHAGTGGTTPKLETVSAPALDMMNVKYILSRDGPPLGGRHRLAFVGEAMVHENRNVMPRAFIADRWVVAEEDEILRAIASPEFDPRAGVYLEEPPVWPAKKPNAGAASYSQVVRADFSAERMGFSVEAQNAGLLFVSDKSYRGWKAMVNGEPAKILRANYVFKAVPIPAGPSEVELWFEPGSVKAGVAAGFAVMLALPCWAFARRRAECADSDEKS